MCSRLYDQLWQCYGYWTNLNNHNNSLIPDDYGPLPGFKQQPIDTLIEFTNQSVICGIRGSLPRSVSWLKDNKELDTKTKNYLSISKEGSLTLFDAKRDRDEGDYRCLVSNTFGSVFSRIAKVTFPCKYQMIWVHSSIYLGIKGCLLNVSKDHSKSYWLSYALKTASVTCQIHGCEMSLL